MNVSPLNTFWKIYFQDGVIKNGIGASFVGHLHCVWVEKFHASLIKCIVNIEMIWFYFT